MFVVNEYGCPPAWVSGVPSGKITGALKLANPNGSAEPIVVGSVIVTVGAPPPLTDTVFRTVSSAVGSTTSAWMTTLFELAGLEHAAYWSR